jgi:hypothetical protein
LTLGLVLIACAAAATRVLAERSTDGFPHAQHRGLFPVCIGCHTGITTGDRDLYYPDPESCADCHDGDRVARVPWPGAVPRASNMRFEHPTHMRLVAAQGTPELDCGGCHTREGAARMNVEAPVVTRCMACHATAATDHFVDADCRTCHRPLVESGFPRERIAALPVPATHQVPDFLGQGHGPMAAAAAESCATCHVREQCTGCHVALAANSPVLQVPAVRGGMEVPRIAPRYPVPATHLDAAWEQSHGQLASRAACGTCHTRESCSTCHRSPPPSAVQQLARADESAAPGVVVSRRMPASHDSYFFDFAHGPLAAGRPRSCTTCHEADRFCAKCHMTGQPIATVAPAASDSPPVSTDSVRAPRPRRAFHPTDWVVRHSAQAWGRRLDCATCHSTQLFCRDCHVKMGFGAIGRVGPGYHDAEPVWLLRHGQAARQTLETCTACHTQRDCMQCHSQLGAFRVSPHGPAFDARAAHRANSQICRACHLSDPLARSGAR